MKYLTILFLFFVLFPALPERINLTTLATGFLIGITLAFCLIDGMLFYNEEVRSE